MTLLLANIDHLPSEGLALIAIASLPTAVLAKLNRRVQPPRSFSGHACVGIWWDFPAAPIKQTPLIRAAVLPVRNHLLGAMIRALLTILAVVRQLLRVVTAFFSYIVASEETR